MNDKRNKKYYENFKDNFERYSYYILNTLWSEIYTKKHSRDFGICKFGYSIKFPSEDNVRILDTNVFYTITPDSLDKNEQKQSIDRLFFQDSDLSNKLTKDNQSLIKLNSDKPYYLIEFRKTQVLST